MRTLFRCISISISLVFLLGFVGGQALATNNDISCNNPEMKPVPTTISAQDQERILAMHNQEREAEGVPPLVWDETLAQFAQGWADAIDQFNQQKTQGGFGNWPHSGESCYATTYGQYGENISSGNASAQKAVELWINEKAFYDRKKRVCEGANVGIICKRSRPG